MKKLTVGLFLVLMFAATAAFAQSTSTLQGVITDSSGAVVPNATVTVTNLATNQSRSFKTNETGNYSFPGLQPGSYKLEVSAAGLGKQTISSFTVDVGRLVSQNFSLKPSQVEEIVSVTGEAPVIDTGTMTVGQVMTSRMVQELPLNGRHIVELTSLVPGTVVPPVNGFLTAPLRGQGSFGVNTAGGREDTTNFMINGINLNDMANGQVTFQPSINTVSEFKMDNSTNSAEFGRNSGSQMMVATRSGTNAFHGELFEFVRNEAFDARNFFNKDTVRQSPFKRNNFGASVGGPIFKNKTLFFVSYEGLRQRQGITVASNVLTSAQRQQVVTNANPTMQELLKLIPTANDPTGSQFLGSLVAPVDIDQWTGDVSHNFNEKDRLHAYYAYQKDIRGEPTLQGGTVPGAGDTREGHRQILTLGETHVFSSTLVNDARFGINRIFITFSPNNTTNPSTIGINNGVNANVGVPQISVGGIGLQFGGVNNFPQGRGDYTGVLSDTVSWIRGDHSFKFGGELRRFNGNSFTSSPGTLTFSNVTNFINAAPTGFTISTGTRASRAFMTAMGLFAMDNWKLTPFFTLELGLRWEWNKTPTEGADRNTVFDPANVFLVRVGTNGRDKIYEENNKLFQPRVGFSWDMFKTGKTVLRGGYAILYDQPLPFTFAGNVPFSVPLNFTPTGAKPTTSFGTLLTDAAGSGITIATVDRNYKNDYIQSYNLNIQHQLAPSMSLMIGYFGNKGTHMDMSLNLNQQIQNPALPAGNYIRPFVSLAVNSPILPSPPTPNLLGNINQRSSVGTSNYNALWVTVTKRLSHGVEGGANYTWSKSIDLNSRNGLGVADSTRPFLDRGPSDFDARHHFSLNTVYRLPFKGNRAIEGWRVGGVLTLQSGNPLNITSGNPGSGLTVGGFTSGGIRPDLLQNMPAPSKQLITSGTQSGNIQWFPSAIVCDPARPSSCTGGTAIFGIPIVVNGGTVGANGLISGGTNVYHYGNLGRNAVLGPDFKNLDFSITKNTKITERISHEFRFEVFNLANHPNLGNPGTAAQFGSTTFGVIRSTRAPAGDFGSSRQLQFAMKLLF